MIRESKFGKSRLVPMAASSMAALQDHAQLRDELQPRSAQPSFFVSLAGTRLLYAVVSQTFRQLVDDSGVGAGAHRPPRLHDYADLLVVPTSARKSLSAGVIAKSGSA